MIVTIVAKTRMGSIRIGGITARLPSVRPHRPDMTFNERSNFDCGRETEIEGNPPDELATPHREHRCGKRRVGQADDLIQSYRTPYDAVHRGRIRSTMV